MRPNTVPYTAEYGTEVFIRNQSTRTVLESGEAEICGKMRRVEFYHHTQGYKPSGSAAIWMNEIVGVRWYDENQGTTHGQMYKMEDMEKAVEHWNRWNVQNVKIEASLA